MNKPSDDLNTNCSIAVLASGNGTNLQKLIDVTESGQIPGRIALVLSNKEDSQALRRAQSHRLPYHFLSHLNYDRREDFDRALLQIVLQSKVDLVVLAGFMRILTEEFVVPLKGRLINLHPSLLPKHPGLKPHQKVLECGEREHGATVHFVTEELDLGPPIVQGRLEVAPEDNATVLKKRVQHEVEYHILPLAVRWYAEGRLRMNGHSVLLDGKVLPKNGFQWRPTDLKSATG